jgi:hypothetical protein
MSDHPAPIESHPELSESEQKALDISNAVKQKAEQAGAYSSPLSVGQRLRTNYVQQLYPMYGHKRLKTSR